MTAYFDYNEAEARMQNKDIVSVNGGEYDYYKIENNTLYGYFSGNDELYEIENEDLNKIKESKWYLIKSATT